MPKGLQETPADGEKGRKGKRGPGKLQRPTIWSISVAVPQRS